MVQYTTAQNPSKAERSGRLLVIVVIQLILALRVHPFISLPLVALLSRPHREVVRTSGVDRGKREFPREIRGFARGTGRLLRAADQGLELVTAALAGVFVDRYDGTRSLEWDILVLPSVVKTTTRHTMLVPHAPEDAGVRRPKHESNYSQ
jgi:hypothetical protein